VAVSNVIERLGRAIFEAPFGADKIAKDAPELAEIRIAVLDAVKAKSHRASGKAVFPYNVVRIELWGVPEEQASVFRSEFLASYFGGELRAGLKRSSYRFPDDLRVEISTTAKLPAAGEQWLAVQAALEEAPPPASAARQAATLVVLAGAANQPEFRLEKVRTHIGRTADIYHSAAGPSRRNDLVFAEDSVVNRSVSREHAHILYSAKTGKYRLFNDRVYKGAANCGIWIVRDGLSQPVHRSARGTVLEPGDEIHLGQAVVRFECS
jgi:hypothetical protein